MGSNNLASFADPSCMIQGSMPLQTSTGLEETAAIVLVRLASAGVHSMVRLVFAAAYRMVDSLRFVVLDSVVREGQNCCTYSEQVACQRTVVVVRLHGVLAVDDVGGKMSQMLVGCSVAEGNERNVPN